MAAPGFCHSSLIRHSAFGFRHFSDTFSIYDPTAFGRKNRCRFWRGEQAQHRVGDREGLVRSRRALDF
jgi:hypothetical protein